MLEEVISILLNYTQCKREEIDKDSNLFMDLQLDSLDAASLVSEIETKYQIQITDDELWSLYSVKDIVQCISNKVETY